MFLSLSCGVKSAAKFRKFEEAFCEISKLNYLRA